MNSSPPAAPGLGVALYSLGVFLFALNDALGKWLVADYGVGQLMMLRSIGAGVVLAPMLASMGRRPVRPRPKVVQAARIVAMAADAFSFYFATRFMPLADVMTFYMAAPLIVIALSRRCSASGSSASAGSRSPSASSAYWSRCGRRRRCSPGFR